MTVRGNGRVLRLSNPSGVSRRRLIAGAAAAGGGGLLAACRVGGRAPSARSGSSSTSTPRPGGQIRVRLTEDPLDWDVSLLGKGSADGIFLAYDNLVGFKAGSDVAYTDAVLAPELAESWEIHDDAGTFILHLRQGGKFAALPPVTGREFTAADVKWSYEYWTRSGQFAGQKLAPGQWAW